MKNKTILIAVALTGALGVSSLAYGLASAASRPLSLGPFPPVSQATAGTQGHAHPVRTMPLAFQHQLLHQGFQVSVEAGPQDYFVTLGPFLPTGPDATDLVAPRQVAFGSLTQTVAGLPVHYTLTRVGASLVATFPKAAVLLGGTFQVAAWDAASEWGDPAQAFYVHDVDFDLL